MIVTNNSSKPSERFTEVISGYFIKSGYTFKKSQNSFVKPFEKGFFVVKLWFKVGTFTDVTFSWWLFFEKLAKLNALLLGKPKNYKNLIYMPSSLAIHTRWEENFEHTWKLYDESSLIYTDMSINIAAEKFIKAFEYYVPNYFEYFKHYESLEKDFNQDEFKNIAGLILAKYFDRPDFESLLQTYSKQVELRESDPEGEEHLILNRFMEFILKNKIKDFL